MIRAQPIEEGERAAAGDEIRQRESLADQVNGDQDHHRREALPRPEREGERETP